MYSHDELYDVIVVGGGHAGIEACHVAAKMGAKTALISLSKKHIGLMPCNPSVGGLGKGHIVYEISALGGLMPKLCSHTYLQARMLNTRKGPAVQGLRLQIDKYAYKDAAQRELDMVDKLEIIEASVDELAIEKNGESASIIGVYATLTAAQSSSGEKERVLIRAKNVVVTAGTFLNGLMHVGDKQTVGGRVGEGAVTTLSQSLHDVMGAQLGRLKTGTPPRLVRESINFDVLERQESQKLDYLFEFDAPKQIHEKLPCYIARTNEETHRIIADNLDKSAMYSGNIKGIGPRYCPSIEDKVGRYSDRPSHHVFVEPEGEHVNEVYPSGLSTSLPEDIQEAYIRSINGFEDAVFAKYGYAVEYDFIQPTALTHTLETKKVSGLFFAGQINGTTGYEEAAGQGILAGINAALKAQEKAPFILSRHESYIGVMVDDLVTLGVDEPYRMFTSRAERRLLLRQDNVFARLMPYAHALGTVDEQLYERFLFEQKIVDRGEQIALRNKPHNPLHKYFDYLEFSPEKMDEARIALAEQLDISPELVTQRALLQLYAIVRYDGYLAREQKEIEKLQKFQELIIPDGFNYGLIEGLSFELTQKLITHSPQTVAQAQLIPGMTPAALSVLIFSIKKSQN